MTIFYCISYKQVDKKNIIFIIKHNIDYMFKIRIILANSIDIR